MHHEEILFKAREYRAGGLTAKEKTDVDRHLATCAECRGLFSRWDDAELPAGFVDRVMADLYLPAARDEKEGWLFRLQWWGAMAALMLVGLVFWRPEREWINADRSFAWNGQAIGSTQPGTADKAPEGANHE